MAGRGLFERIQVSGIVTEGAGESLEFVLRVDAEHGDGAVENGFGDKTRLGIEAVLVVRLEHQLIGVAAKDILGLKVSGLVVLVIGTDVG